MSDPHASFMRAQREWDNRTPPEAVECPECGEYDCEHIEDAIADAEAAAEDAAEERARERRYGL